jgi:flavin-dependent dehydrogenase
MNIVIVGGGTAGWIAAYYISKSQPNTHIITVIESSKLGIIGAGEGSTGALLEILNGSHFNFKVDINQFLKETDGTIKMGILHKNWTGDNSSYFAPLDGTNSAFHFDDNFFKYAFYKFGKEKMHVGSNIGKDFSKHKWNQPTAFHFDGHKVGKFFKKICDADRIKHIDDVVTEINHDENKNIISLNLDNGHQIYGDLFIDCTGFARVLMKSIDVGWNSYKEYLPVNSAMPFLLDYEPGEKPLPLTTATALSSGWMWDIPLQTRRGCGYVFDDNFISHEEAQKEVENYLGKKIKPIKWIKFESGRSETFWKNNVLCLGLASTFLEPLEATSIHTTIVQLLMFVRECLLKDKDKTLTEYNRHSYNEKTKRLYDLTMDFISFHYQGNRNDSEFWKSFYNQKRISPNAQIFLNKSKNHIPGFLEINGIVGSPSVSLWNWISAGIDVINQDQAKQELIDKNVYNYYEKEFNKFLVV